MRVVLSSLTFDPLGVVALDVGDKTSYGELRRRMNRIATLDGDAVRNDFGYTEADRTIKLVWEVTDPADEAAVERLLALYAELIISTRVGLFRAAPEVYTPGAAESTLSLLVVTKLA